MLSPMGAVTFQREPIGSLWPELLPLAAAHWHEVRWDGDSEANLDQARYEAAEASGAYAILTARGEHHELGHPLIGYASFWLCPSSKQAGVLEAGQDALYLRPDCRRGWLGAELVRAAERMLVDLGVRTVFQTVRQNARDFGAVLVRLGYQPIEQTYARSIG